MGLGPLHTIGLADARLHAIECRKQKLVGVDPIDARRAIKAQLRHNSASARTFKHCADAYIESHKDGWRNAKHADQWKSTLEAYAWPYVKNKTTQEITTEDVLKILKPIWRDKTETASRLRGRIEAILDWATAHGYRTGENPARWRGHIENLLPKRSKVSKVQHHAALPFAKIGSFFSQIQQEQTVSSWAFQYLILTAARTSEVVAACWDEIGFDEKIWVIPGDRMKSGREHRVPLATHALDILSRAKIAQKRGGLEQSKYVFSSGRIDRHLSNMALLKMLQRLGKQDLTVHGFRSTFRDWASEATSHAREVAEMALAHTIGDKVEAAYRRGDLFDKRRKLMEDWASYCHENLSTMRMVA